MNIFGAFTFGSLIKTFLPGVVWLIAIGVLEVGLAACFGFEPFLVKYVQNSQQAALVLGFPAAILLGLVSNIIVFMGINDALVRNPVKKQQRALFNLYDRLATRIRDRCWGVLGLTDVARDEFDTHTDVEVIMLPTLGHEALAYMREQYWYHLEFQMNLLLSLAVLFLGISIYKWTSTNSAMVFAAQLFVYLGIFLPICAALLSAARKNYCRHISKMASLMAGVLCPQPEEESG